MYTGLVQYCRGSNIEHLNSEHIQNPYVSKTWFQKFLFLNGQAIAMVPTIWKQNYINHLNTKTWILDSMGVWYLNSEVMLM